MYILNFAIDNTNLKYTAVSKNHDFMHSPDYKGSRVK